MSSKSSNNFSNIYLSCIILRNVNINLRFYIRYVNIWIAAFISAYLYWGIITMICILHMLCKRVFCLIYIDIFIFGNIRINLFLHTVCKRVNYHIYSGIFMSGNININLRFYITYVNIRIVAFTYAHLYLGILTLSCILHMECKRVVCLIYIDIFIFGNININWYFYIRVM